jgi:hexosaminidase
MASIISLLIMRKSGLTEELLISNRGETKRFSRNDKSAALAKGLHEINRFLGHIIGGWPSNRNNGSVSIRKSDVDQFSAITPEMLFH